MKDMGQPQLAEVCLNLLLYPPNCLVWESSSTPLLGLGDAMQANERMRRKLAESDSGLGRDGRDTRMRLWVKTRILRVRFLIATSAKSDNATGWTLRHSGSLPYQIVM